MSDLKRHRDEECEEEECVAVKGCRKGRPVKVRFEEDCEPIPVRLEQRHCEPLSVKLEQKHCEPLQVHIKGHPKVRQEEGDCWHVQGCKDGEPIPVTVVNAPPPPSVQNDMFVFNGATWEPLLTPSKFIPIVQLQLTASSPMAIWTPATGKKFRFMGVALTSTLQATYNFRDGFGGPIIKSIGLSANVPFAPPPLGNGILSTTPGNPLVLELVNGAPTALAEISGNVMGQEV